jgi:hypothetical protein
MHKSLTELLSKDGNLLSVAEDVLTGLEIKDRDKPPSDSQKKLIIRTLALIDSGRLAPDAMKQAKAESYPQTAPSAIAVSDKGAMAQVAQEVANRVDPELMQVAQAGLRKLRQEEMLGGMRRALTVYPAAIGSHVDQAMLASIQDKSFVDETCGLIRDMLSKEFGL